LPINHTGVRDSVQLRLAFALSGVRKVMRGLREELMDATSDIPIRRVSSRVSNTAADWQQDLVAG